MPIIRKLIASLATDEGVSRQIQWYLLSLRVYWPTKRQYERKYPINKDKRRETNLKFPEYPRLFKYYNVTSNIVIGWVFLKTLFPSAFNGWHKVAYHHLIGRWSSIEIQPSLHCYSFGRLIIHNELSDELLSGLFCSWHLFWRLAQVLLDRPLSVDMVTFLLQPREEIEKFTRKLEAANKSIERARRRQRRLSLPYKSLTAPLGLNYHQLSQSERLLCDVMCYEVTFVHEAEEEEEEEEGGGGKAETEEAVFEEPARVLYQLRANRTLQAHQRLVGSLVSTTTIATLILVLLVVSIGLYLATVATLNQHRYAKDYHNCDPEFSQLYAAGWVHYWSLPRLTGHRLAVIAFDSLETVYLWLECGTVLIYGLLFVNILNRDLIYYWDHLEDRIETLTAESRNVHYFFENLQCGERMLRVFHEQVYELQGQLGDFYRQIQQVDLLVSDVITHALLIWLSFFGYLSYKSADLYASTRNAEIALILISIAVFVFVGYSLVNISLLSLQRRCHLAYLNLCTLMAYDHSKHKRNFGTILLYYTEKNRTCYTWFQQVPFTSANYLSVIGWSVTGFLVLDGLYHRA